VEIDWKHQLPHKRRRIEECEIFMAEILHRSKAGAIPPSPQGIKPRRA
jgi:hypothetical protein